MKSVVVTLGSLVMIISASLLAHGENVVCTANETSIITESYKEIDLSELPSSISEYITENMEGALISKAFKDENGNFKVLVQLEGVELTQFFDAEGKPVE